MEASIGFRVCRSIVSRWTRRGSYQRLPTTTSPAWPVAARGVRLGRRSVLLGSAARRSGQPRTESRWSPLQLVRRIVDAYLNSMAPRSLKMTCEGATSSPKLLRVASKHGVVDRRGVMLNFCVAEVLRRSSSEVRRSPLRPRKGKAARTSAAAC